MRVQNRDIIAGFRSKWKIHRELHICQLSGLVSYRRLIKKYTYQPLHPIIYYPFGEESIVNINESDDQSDDEKYYLEIVCVHDNMRSLSQWTS